MLQMKNTENNAKNQNGVTLQNLQGKYLLMYTC